MLDSFKSVCLEIKVYIMLIRSSHILIILSRPRTRRSILPPMRKCLIIGKCVFCRTYEGLSDKGENSEAMILYNLNDVNILLKLLEVSKL